MAHQSIVGVERNAEFLLIENLEGMLRQTWRGAGVDIAEQAKLQRDSFVEHVLRKVAQLYRLAIYHGDVVDQARAVPNPVRPAILDRLPDR